MPNFYGYADEDESPSKPKKGSGGQVSTGPGQSVSGQVHTKPSTRKATTVGAKYRDRVGSRRGKPRK